MAKKLLLLDGHSLAFRAFYALPTDLATPEGTITNAVYGFTSMLVKVLADEKPDYIGVVFDAPGRTYRHDLDGDYKGNRKETPDIFVPQLPLIKEVVEALHIPVLQIEGVEADDVIATLATRADDEGIDAILVTGDRDSYALVHDPHVKVLYNRRGVSDYALYDEAGIIERTGVTAAQYLDYASLRGDPSDNLPGVPGIGEKTAAKLINAYGGLEGIYEHLDELPPKQRQNLADGRERVFLNREISRLLRDVELDVGPSDLVHGAWDRDTVRVLFDQLAFRTLWPRLLDAVGDVATESDAGSASLDVDVAVLRDSAAVVARVQEILDAGELYAIEPRWEGAPVTTVLRAIAIATADGASAYVEAERLGDPAVRDALLGLLGAGGPPLVAHRAKDLIHGLGIDIRALRYDTAVMAYLLDPAPGKYVLEDLALRYLALEVSSPDAEPGTLDLDGEVEIDHTGRRAVAALQLAGVLEAALRVRELADLYERFELPLVRVLADMERAGIRIDREFLEELSAELGQQCEMLVQRIYALAGEEFNVNSTPQLRTILFEKLGLIPVKKTKTGPSTDADSLQKMADEHPIVEELLRYREVEKLRSTYADALPPLIRSDGRIHATFKQTDTTTGRISSEAPNLQNVPVRSPEVNRDIRRAFIAADGAGLLTADYSQIELRVLAHLAEDPGLIDAFDRGVDVHTATAAAVFHVSEANVDDAQRRFAKVVNYGLAYGMEAYGLGQRLDIPTHEAAEILDAYFTGFPNVKSYMVETVREAKERGYTTTIFGRRRQITELASDNFRIRQMGERMAQNAPVQGSAADIFKLAMIELDAALDAAELRSQMLLTVHDELVLEVPVDEREATSEVVREVMENVAVLRVPLVVDMGFGPTWAEAK